MQSTVRCQSSLRLLYLCAPPAGVQELPLVAPYAKQGGLRPALVDIIQHVAVESVVGEGMGKGLRDPFHHDENFYVHAGL